MCHGVQGRVYYPIGNRRPADKAICSRLHRRGGKFERFPDHLVGEIRTAYHVKLRNLDSRAFVGKRHIKRLMAHVMQPIYEQNNTDGVLVANPNGWGLWE